MIRRFCEGGVYPFPHVFVVLGLLCPYSLSAIEPFEGWNGGVNHGGGSVIYSSPAVLDIDGNPENGKEIVIGSADGYLHALGSDGTVLWSAALPNANCKDAGDTNKLLSSPALGDLYGNGTVHAVVGYGGVGGKSCGGGVYSVNAITGEKSGHFNLRKYNDAENYWSFSYSVFSTPSLFDTNRDGTLEVGLGAFDRRLYLLPHTLSRPIWSLIVADTVWSSASFAFFGNDQTASMLIGTDISRNDQLIPKTPNGGYFYKLNTTSKTSGTPKQKKRNCKKIKKKKKRRRCRKRQKQNRARAGGTISYGFRDPDAFDYYKVFDQVLYSAQAVGDILPDRNGLEIVTGFGCFFPQDSNNKRGDELVLMDGETGNIIHTMKAPGCSESSPAIGDLDGDGTIEIVATFNVHKNVGGNGTGQIVAYSASTGEQLWQVDPSEDGSDAYAAFKYSPIIADLNGDGGQEVIVANSGSIRIYDGATGSLLSCDGRSCNNGKARLKFGSAGRNTPAIADLDNDGDLELIAAGGGKVHVFDDFSDLTGATPGNNEPYTASWPMWRRDAARTGSTLSD